MIELTPATQAEVDALFEMEVASYPADEAASRDGISMRIREAGEYFFVAHEAESSEGGVAEGTETKTKTTRRPIVGFVNGTKTSSSRLTHESMSTHDADGSLLCIHSVVVSGKRRREGIGRRMLTDYCDIIRGAQGTNGVREIRLLCKENLIAFYAGASFEMVGVSDVVHGADVWHEMRLLV